MSRIGKKPIEKPEKVELKITENKVIAQGPRGELALELPEGLLVEEKNGWLFVKLKDEQKNISALWGLTRALLQNIILGVSRGFNKQLELVGVGYRAALEGEKVLNLNLGFSHPVKMAVPQGLEVKVEKNVITISGIDKQKVGQFSAEIRKQRPPEPYKGKGVRYLGEKVRRKEGKKSATAAS